MLQTLKFVKELGRWCGVRSAVLLGGDSMDQQFSLVHSRPDLVVATPGNNIITIISLTICVTTDLIKTHFSCIY